MSKKRLLIASVSFFCLTVLATGAWAFTQSRAAAHTDALLARVNAVCENPDAPACAAMLNQLEPGA